MIENRCTQNNLIENLTFLPMLGAVGGCVAGIGIRIWEGIPSDFTYPSHNIAPIICPHINSLLQIAFKGWIKYAVALAPTAILISKAAYTGYQNNNWNLLWEQIFSYETIFAISALALTALICSTQPYWIGYLASVGLDAGDISGHVLMTFATASALSTGLQTLWRQATCTEKIALGVLTCLVTGATSIFILNTVLHYHTIIETSSACLASMGILALSHTLAKRSSI